MKSTAETVEAYLRALVPDRRGVRSAMLENLGPDRGMQCGMTGYVFPLARYPDTQPPLAVASPYSQRTHLSPDLLGVCYEALCPGRRSA